MRIVRLQELPKMPKSSEFLRLPYEQPEAYRSPDSSKV